jgi:hypothetical protein
MLPNVVTFWHGPLDALRQLCLRSQVAAGHKVTVYSFEPLPGLPDGVGNAEAEAILPHSFAEKLRPSGPDGAWRDWTTLQFSDFFRMRLMARNEGIWLDADVLLLKRIEINPAKPYFAWEGPRRLGNSVLYLPPNDPIIAAFEELMQQKELTPDWLAKHHRLIFGLRRIFSGSNRLSDLRVAIYGPASLTALAYRTNAQHHALSEKSFYSVHAKPRLFFEPTHLSPLIEDPEVIGFHISPKKRGNELPIPGSLYAWAAAQFGTSFS